MLGKEGVRALVFLDCCCCCYCIVVLLRAFLALNKKSSKGVICWSLCYTTWCFTRRVLQEIIPQYVKTRFWKVPFSCRIAVSRRQQSGRGRQRSGPNPSLRRTLSICEHIFKQWATIDDVEWVHQTLLCAWHFGHPGFSGRANRPLATAPWFLKKNFFDK